MRNRWMILLMVVALLMAGLACGSSQTVEIADTPVTIVEEPTIEEPTAIPPTAAPTPTPEPPTAIPEPTATFQSIAPSCSEIVEGAETRTSAQWEAYSPTIEGKQVISWTGHVEDVLSGPFGGYELWVEVGPGWVPQCTAIFDISDDLALEFEVDQMLVFSGTIDYLSGYHEFVTVWLKDVTLEN